MERFFNGVPFFCLTGENTSADMRQIKGVGILLLFRLVKFRYGRKETN